MNSKLINIFSESGCPAEGVLQKYINEELSHSKKHEVEKHLIDCEMCNDEVEGLKLMNDSVKLNSIVDKINNQITHKTKVRILKPLFSFVRIAAVLLILLIIGSLYILYNNLNNFESNQALTDNIKQITNTEQPLIESSLSENIKRDSVLNDKITNSTRKVIAENRTDKVENEGELFSKLNIYKKNEANKGSEIKAKVVDDEINTISGENIGASTMAYDNVLSDNLINDASSSHELAESNQEPILEEKTVILSGKATVARAEDSESITSSFSNKSNSSSSKKSKSKNDNKDEIAPASAIESDKISYSNNSVNRNSNSTVDIDNSKVIAQESEKEILKSSGTSNDLLLNLAIDDYSTEKYNEAKEKLEQIIENKDFELFQKVQWYYALTLLKLNNIVKAEKILNEIVNTQNHIYMKEAQEKLTEID